MTTCMTCGGDGYIVTCVDDTCVGIGHCMHGDGEETCPDCSGEGEIFDGDDDLYPDDDDIVEISKPASPLEMRLDQQLVEAENRLKIVQHERFAFYKLVKEAVENGVDFGWIDRAKETIKEFG